MTFAWIDCDLLEHPKIAELPSDSARLGFVAAILKGKRQAKPGHFANEKHFRYVMGRFGRFLPMYVERRLIDVSADGGLAIHDWSDYQRDKVDNTAADRQRRYRDRNRNGDSNAVTPVTDNASHAGGRAVALPVLVDVLDGEKGVQREEGVLARLVESLTNRPFGYGIGSKVWTAMAEDIASCGFARVETAYRQTVRDSESPLDAAGVIYGGHKRLFPIPDAPRRLAPKDQKAQDIADVKAEAQRRIREAAASA